MASSEATSKVKGVEKQVDNEDLSKIPDMTEQEAVAHQDAAHDALEELVQSTSPGRWGETNIDVLQKTEKIERHPWLCVECKSSQHFS
jgi:hypothetical protein